MISCSTSLTTWCSLPLPEDEDVVALDVRSIASEVLHVPIADLVREDGLGAHVLAPELVDDLVCRNRDATGDAVPNDDDAAAPALQHVCSTTEEVIHLGEIASKLNAFEGDMLIHSS